MLSKTSEAYREQIQSFLNERIEDKKSKLKSFVLGRIRSLQKAIEI